MDNKKHTTCLICKSDKLKHLERYSNNYLVKCKSCGMVFCEPVPSVEELNAYYKTYAYENNFYSPITKQRYLELLEVFEKYRKTNKILDIGCGNGFFLETAKEQGWDVYGTEYSEKAIEIIQQKGIKSIKGELNINDFNNDMFDVITSFEVIEHINNHIDEIKKIKTLLRVGGAFYITTPNFNSLSRYLLKEKWNIIGYPEHLAYFTSKTLNKLLTDNNFKKIYIKTTGFSISRYKQSKKIDVDNEKNISSSKTDEKLREKMQKKGIIFYFVKIINRILIVFNIGDTIKTLYVKR